MPDNALIDTSNMSEGQRAALEMAEDSRDTREISGFAGALFMGQADFSRLFPFPQQSQKDKEAGDAFLSKLAQFLEQHTDPDAIDRDGEIPDSVFQGLADLGAFGIKIPKPYGGLGLSQSNYSRAAKLLGAHCGNLTALLSAHQSIGMPQPLIVFGTEEQKQKFLPYFANGQVSAFALTEQNVGSDPAKMSTEATLDQDGEHYTLNGEKLWCTNGLKASHIVVMAKTATPEKPYASTAFIVDTSWEGVEIVTRCHFMGLRALYNGVVRFTNVKIPKDHVVHQVGKGLKVALTTLNTGRLTLPAACSGAMQCCLDISLRWAREREQWGSNIGKHAAIAQKIADIRADQFATESMVQYVSALVDNDKKADIRIEAAMAKLWGTEAAWRSVDQTMQLKGGRGYETADSLKNRGETPDPIERMLRDCRINTIFEGSSEIMKLFIAREALDPHLRRGAAAIDSRLPMSQRAIAAAKAGTFYSLWYPARWLPIPANLPKNISPALAQHLNTVHKTSQKLARCMFHAMALNGPALEKRQILLGAFVDIATELFAMTCAIARTQALIDQDAKHPLHTIHYLCARSKKTIKQHFLTAKDSVAETSGYKLAQELLKHPAP
ncbi:acyl-CoA dehydrogenase family protein [Rubritalea marina]|uniref:acyl-CoA dehydrogenase family protein n=1 Tax=Rubritalea marina TaxID=361055 RepID=UPI00036A0E4C|nr:acyl-CoA dehydrogenase family protein [Rubritalea marina]